MSPSDWFVEKFNADPAGWIALFLVVIGAIVASVWWKRIVRWSRALPGRYRAHMTRKYGTAPPPPPPPAPIQSTVAVTFYQAIDGERSNVDQLGRRKGGVIMYELRNHGPSAADDVRIELLGPELQAESPLYVGPMQPNEFRFVTVRVPFGAKHDALLLWRQAEASFQREIVLPLQ